MRSPSPPHHHVSVEPDFVPPWSIRRSLRRPKVMAAVILEQRPSTSADLVEFWSFVAFGTSTAIQKRYGVKPRIQDRLAAASQLADRLHGRAIPAVEEVDPIESVPTFALPADADVATK